MAIDENKKPMSINNTTDVDLTKNDDARSTSTQESSGKPPDGGWGWVVVFASFIVNVILDGVAFSFGMLLIPLIEEFESNRSTISWAGSLVILFYILACPGAGALVKRFDCRKICIMGCLIGCLGFGLSTISPNIPFLMIFYGVVGGYGLGTMYLPSIVIVNQYFDSRRGLATGIADSGSGIGGMILPPLVTWMMKMYGWQGATVLFGVLCLSGIMFASLMTPLRNASATAKDEEKDTETQKESSHLTIWKNPFFLLVAFGNFFGHLGMFVPYTYLPDAAVVQNISTDNANYLLSAMGVTNTIGRIAFTAISDIPWVNPYWAFASSIFLCGISTFVAPLCHNYATFIVVSLSFGFFSSCWALTPIVIVRSLGLDNLSQAMGYMMVFRGSGIVGPPIGGLLFDATKSYDIPFFMAGSVYAIAALLVVVAALMQKRKSLENNHQEANESEMKTFLPEKA